ncbi:MAG: adenylate/guanylate cyclase domain-containing protein [Alphaproteobacteria bacterium]
MNDKRPKRRLAAILAADVVGYSRMMAADETGTLDALKRHREIEFDPAVARYNGRIVKLIGDGTLVEFASVIEAVECALEVQRAAHATASNGSSRIVLRIGVNLGDIIIEGDDIYGDGVNIAARLEPLAAPGGICISAIVSDSVRRRVDVEFDDSGEVSVKNIDQPIRVWKWHPAGAAVTTPEPDHHAATPISQPGDTPSIAVLPLDNMSGDPEQEYFCDGITEDVITDLSKIGGLLVIARNSSFAYKGKSIDVKAVGRELGVGSILEGSIRRAGNRVRITAQLIDVSTGGHLWAERYDRDVDDIFAVQDDVTQQIVGALRVTLTPNERSLIANTGTTNLDAREYYMRAQEFLFGPNKNLETFDRAKAQLGRAIELDPDYAEAIAGLGFAHMFDFHSRWSDGADKALQKAIEYAEQAIIADPVEPFGHLVASRAAMYGGNLERATAEAGTALAINPNYALGYYTLGCIQIYSGQPLAGIPQLEKAMVLDPVFGHQYLHFTGTAHLVAGDYEEAAASFEERVRLAPETDLTRAFLASALGHLGRTEDAQRVWRELGNVNPNYIFADHISRLPFKLQSSADVIKEGLVKAGLLE